MESSAGDYASYDFSARTRGSMTPRSGFVQSAFRPPKEEKEELREWLDGYDPIMEREWAAVAQERIRQIESGEVAPLDGEQVLKEMRQLAKQLAQQ